MHQLEKLNIWKKSMELTKEIYKITKEFPDEEKFGLISQMRRSAVSVCSNIAERAGRNSIPEFVHFLAIANGSAYELQTQLMLARDMGFVQTEKADNLSI